MMGKTSTGRDVREHSRTGGLMGKSMGSGVRQSWVSILVCVMFFLMVKQSFWVWGRKSTEIKCHSYYIVLIVQAINMIYHVNVDLDHLAEA